MVPSPTPNPLSRLLIFPAVLIAALMAVVFVLAAFNTDPPITDPDVYWHLTNARHLVTTHHFIRADTDTFTVNGHPWINFEWLSELPYYYAFLHFGERGLFAVMMLLAEAIILGIFLLAWLRSHEIRAALLTTWIAALLATVSLAPRTLLFGWLCLIAELLILWTYKENKNYTWALPPLFFLWINLHGSWLIGFVFLLVFIAANSITVTWGSIATTAWPRPERNKWLLITALTFAALFLNPYGWRLVAYPLDVAFQQKLTLLYVEEWASLDFHLFRGKLMLAVLLGMAALNLIRRRTWLLADLLLASITIYAALTYSRFLFLAAIVLSPLLALDLKDLLGHQAAKPNKPLINAAAIAILIFGVAHLYPTQTRLHAQVAAVFPEAALPAIRALPPNARILNFYDWGGYLTWNIPTRPVFLDGRTDIFVHEGIMKDYASVLNANQVFEILDRYRITHVLFPRGGPFPYLLLHSPQWHLIYEDPQTQLFARQPLP
ncbi:hypothetical protein AciX9_4174 (plasmid) [Granulicella tundricola MP5ACTX9]|uniref:Glycosyltransferase RgtA/B/C/D-like domain-containing protein n=2 Tax=Granulicella TaxID=940557 RepID=E8X670_GRATM|nr:hypothetical protein AciX9_4174 [Granulicella tundricola MP5ACTX9]